MALKFERVFVRNLQSSNSDLRDFTPEIITEIIGETCKTEPKFRLEWGGEYLDFRLNEGRTYLIPERGSVSLLQNSAMVVPQNAKSFVSLAASASQFFVFEGPKGVNLLPINFFDVIQVVGSKDYPKMLSDLEKAKKVRTAKSTNVLSVSGQRFQFEDPDAVCIYGPVFYEADSLGTTMFVKLSKTIETMWTKSQLKDGQEES